MVFRGACIYCFPNDPELRSKFCLFFFAMRVQFHVLYHLILIFSYIYRVIVITNPLKRIDKRKTVYIGLSTYSILHFMYFSWVCIAAFQPMEVINREISKYEPSIVGSNATYNGIVNLKDPSQIGMN
uniref:G protein-coupled receptor n=1 Tax=Caenorhabditis tropicalis TaxID=1561998 RepID=A0A1I7SYV6_9PELO